MAQVPPRRYGEGALDGHVPGHEHQACPQELAAARAELAAGVDPGATRKAEKAALADLRGALTPVDKSNFAAITDPQKVGALLRAIDAYQRQPAVQYALKIAPYVFVRPGELPGARWSEFTLDGKEPTWRIHAHRFLRSRSRCAVIFISPTVTRWRQISACSCAGAVYGLTDVRAGLRSNAD